MRLPQRSTKAFTLIELIVVVVILGILALIAIPTFGKVIGKSQDESTLTTLRAVARNAQALRALDQASAWGTTPADAIGETNQATSAGTLAAAMTAVLDDGTKNPLAGQVTYLPKGDGLVLSMLSGSKRICVLGLNPTALGTGKCVDVTGTTSVASALSDGPTSILPSGTSMSAPSTGGGPYTPPSTVVTATGQMTTVAGSGTKAYVDGTGTAAAFNSIRSMVTDGSFIYIADAGSNRIRKLNPVTQEVTTLAGSDTAGRVDATGAEAQFSGPSAIATDGTYLYVGDYGTGSIRKVEIATQKVTTIAGGVSFGYKDGVDGLMGRPYGGMAVVGKILYFADTNINAIRTLNTETRELGTLAGSSMVNGSQDGPLASATFSAPKSVTVSGGFLYVTDAGAVRKIDLVAKTVATVPGSANLGLSYPVQTVVDGDTLYVADRNNGYIRKISISTGSASIFVGSLNPTSDLDGFGTAARTRYPSGLIALNGSLYVGEETGAKIRKIS